MKVVPLSAKNWQDFEKLFSPGGACAGCWCMYWRLSKKTWKEGQGNGNKRKMKKLVTGKQFTGLLAYIGKQVVGWCALGPREEYPVLNKSKILGKVDEEKVWSIVCFYIARRYRRNGISGGLIAEAVNYVRKKKIKILEGYPVLPDKESYPDTFAYTGFYRSFVKAGFKEVARRSATRPVMRYTF